MKRSPNVDHTTITKEGKKGSTAFPGIIQSVGTPPIHGPVKNGIEIPKNKGGNRRINFGGDKTEKGVPIRIPVRGINTDDTKNHITILKFSQNKTTIRVSTRIKQRISRPEENNRTTGVRAAGGNNRQEAVRRKPGIALGN